MPWLQIIRSEIFLWPGSRWHVLLYKWVGFFFESTVLRKANISLLLENKSDIAWFSEWVRKRVPHSLFWPFSGHRWVWNVVSSIVNYFCRSLHLMRVFILFVIFFFICFKYGNWFILHFLWFGAIIPLLTGMFTWTWTQMSSLSWTQLNVHLELGSIKCTPWIWIKYPPWIQFKYPPWVGLACPPRVGSQLVRD